MQTYPVKIKLNGRWRETQVSAGETLLHTLREKLDAFEVKNGCEQGDCGACAIILDGKNVNSCLTLTLQADGKEVTTLKGIGNRAQPDQLQESFLERGAIQCGFCTAGMVVSAKTLLEQNPSPSRQEIKKGLSGNLCRCTGYTKIIEAVEDAAAKA